jgi:hypothetical protein
LGYKAAAALGYKVSIALAENPMKRLLAILAFLTGAVAVEITTPVDCQLMRPRKQRQV